MRLRGVVLGGVGKRKRKECVDEDGVVAQKLL